MLKDLVYNCRSYRRFYENVKISDAELKDLADLARMTASTDRKSTRLNSSHIH